MEAPKNFNIYSRMSLQHFPRDLPGHGDMENRRPWERDLGMITNNA
jgi:hypothetical protein